MVDLLPDESGIRVVNKHWYKGPGEFIGRPSPLGNPFSHLPNARAQYHVATREEAVEKYLPHLRTEYMKGGAIKEALDALVQKYIEQGELTLICFCAPAACHGHVIREAILKLARRYASYRVSPRPHRQ